MFACSFEIYNFRIKDCNTLAERKAYYCASRVSLMRKILVSLESWNIMSHTANVARFMRFVAKGLKREELCEA